MSSCQCNGQMLINSSWFAGMFSYISLLFKYGDLFSAPATTDALHFRGGILGGGRRGGGSSGGSSCSLSDILTYVRTVLSSGIVESLFFPKRNLNMCLGILQLFT